MSISGGARLNLFLFSVGGACFGCDAEQAEGMSAYDGEEPDDLFWFHEELGYGDREVGYRAPSVITIRTEGTLRYRVVIDMMEDLVEVDVDEINPFPRIVEPFVLNRGLWGVVEIEGRMVLLMDFLRFLRDKGMTRRRG